MSTALRCGRQQNVYNDWCTFAHVLMKDAIVLIMCNRYKTCENETTLSYRFYNNYDQINGANKYRNNIKFILLETDVTDMSRLLGEGIFFLFENVCLLIPAKTTIAMVSFCN
jgi:hypothetical protein